MVKIEVENRYWIFWNYVCKNYLKAYFGGDVIEISDKKVKNHQTIGRSGGFTIALKLSLKKEK